MPSSLGGTLDRSSALKPSSWWASTALLLCWVVATRPGPEGRPCAAAAAVITGGPERPCGRVNVTSLDAALLLAANQAARKRSECNSEGGATQVQRGAAACMWMSCQSSHERS